MAKILVIDDDGIVRDAIKAFLTRSGHDVFCASDGLNGISLFKNISPDIVILDREMPNLTGSQVLAKIRELSETVHIIVLTGYDSPEDAQEYTNRGANSFLSKANGISPLIDEIEKITNASSLKEEKNKVKEIKKVKVLIADDEESIRNMLSRFISSIGFLPLTAENGIEAVNIFKKEFPQIVLLDIYMPLKNGIETLGEIIDISPQTSIFMITGNEEEELARECLKKGAFDYISKPINFKKLEISLKSRLTIMGL